MDLQSFARPHLDPKKSQLLWQTMHDTIKKHGLDASTASVLIWKIPFLTILLAIGLWTSWQVSHPLLLGLSCLGLAFVLAQFAFIGHDAGHGSLLRQRHWNSVLGQLCMTLVTGLAFKEWYGRHRSHHQYCQYEAKDPDMAVDLVVSLTEDSRRRKQPLGRFLTRYQAISIWFLSLLFAHSQRLLSQSQVLKHPLSYPLDTLMLILHFALWWGIPVLLLDLSIAKTALIYVLPLFFLGPYLAAIFWVNHIDMPLIEKPEDFSFLEHQAVTSRTVINPAGMDWFFGGLNFQVEHHLFPQIPSFRLRQVQRIVEPALAREAVPYNAVGVWQAYRQIFTHFRYIAKGQS